MTQRLLGRRLRIAAACVPAIAFTALAGFVGWIALTRPWIACSDPHWAVPFERVAMARFDDGRVVRVQLQGEADARRLDPARGCRVERRMQ